MRIPILALSVALCAGAALAQTSSGLRPITTIQCLEPGGHLIPAVCDAPASRLDNREYICLCSNGGMRVDVPVCAKGEREPPDGRALSRVRDVAARDGSLVGDMLDGKPICVAPRGRE